MNLLSMFASKAASHKLNRKPHRTFEPLEGRLAFSGVPVLNSLSGAERQLFLDFDGDYRETWGASRSVFTPAFDLDGDSANVSEIEKRFIEQVWEHVAEDFRPFQINVTTVQPPSIADGVGLHVAIGGNGSWNSTGAGLWGIAPSIGSFWQPYSPNTVFVFSQNIIASTPHPIPRFVADTASHEAGHAFGLAHQSRFSGGWKTHEYNPGDAGVAPLMGNSHNAERSVWFNGLNSGGHPQDDLLIMNADRMRGYDYPTQRGLQFRADDHGSNQETSTPLTPTGATFSTQGIIETNTDLDYFRIQSAGGPIDVSVSVLPSIANLDAAIEIRNSQNQVVAAASPTNSLNARITTNLPAGTYYVVVRNSGEYGALGQYWVSGTFNHNPDGPAEQFAIYRNQRFIIDSGRPGFEGFETADQYSFGLPGDIPVVGDWDGNGIDDFGVYRPAFGRFILDKGNRGYQGNEESYQFGLPTDNPVIGDWNGDGIDDLGVFRPSTGQFILDTGARGYEGHEIHTSTYQFGLSTDRPVVGDWNGDGKDDLGVFRTHPDNPVMAQFILDTGHRGYEGFEATNSAYSFGLSSDVPVIGDWNRDGVDDLGVYRPEFGHFYQDTGLRGYEGPEGEPQNVYQFGVWGDTPLIGRWGTSALATALPPSPAELGVSVTPVYGSVPTIGDLNDDGQFGLRDLVLLRDQLGRTHGNPAADLDTNGVVDRNDVASLLRLWGIDSAGTIPAPSLSAPAASNPPAQPSSAEAVAHGVTAHEDTRVTKTRRTITAKRNLAAHVVDQYWHGVENSDSTNVMMRRFRTIRTRA